MITDRRTDLYSLTEQQFRTLELLCEHLVPGSGPAGPAVYIDSVACEWSVEQTDALRRCLDGVTEGLHRGESIAQAIPGSHYGRLRELVIEAYYSDFKQPGYSGPGAWVATGFISAPMAQRAKKDWSFLRCFQSTGE